MRPVLLMILTCSALGCNSGKRIAAANDQLRLDREAQADRLTHLEAENAELRTKLAEAIARAESPLPDDVIEALPRTAKIELTRFSGIESGTVTWSIKPTDGRGRFVQVVGTLELRAVTTSETPAVIASALLSPTELRDAYSTGLTGAGYRISLPATAAFEGPVTLTASLHDHVAGVKYEAIRLID